MPSASNAIYQPHRIKRLNAVVGYVGLSRSTVYRLMKLDQFPAPIRLGPNSIGWDAADLDAWLDAKRAPQAARSAA